MDREERKSIDNIVVNEQAVMSAHHKLISEMEKKLREAQKIVDEYKNNPTEKMQSRFRKAYNIVSTYPSQIEKLREELLKRQDIIYLAKMKKKAYLEAKERYDKLSAMKKLQIMARGKALKEWSVYEKDANVHGYDFDILYNEGRAR